MRDQGAVADSEPTTHSDQPLWLTKASWAPEITEPFAATDLPQPPKNTAELSFLGAPLPEADITETDDDAQLAEVTPHAVQVSRRMITTATVVLALFGIVVALWGANSTRQRSVHLAPPQATPSVASKAAYPSFTDSKTIRSTMTGSGKTWGTSAASVAPASPARSSITGWQQQKSSGHSGPAALSWTGLEQLRAIPTPVAFQQAAAAPYTEVPPSRAVPGQRNSVAPEDIRPLPDSGVRKLPVVAPTSRAVLTPQTPQPQPTAQQPTAQQPTAKPKKKAKPRRPGKKPIGTLNTEAVLTPGLDEQTANLLASVVPGGLTIQERS